MRGEKAFRAARESGVLRIPVELRGEEVEDTWFAWCRANERPVITVYERGATGMLRIDMTPAGWVLSLLAQKSLATVLSTGCYRKSTKVAQRPFIRVLTTQCVADGILKEKLNNTVDEVVRLVYQDIHLPVPGEIAELNVQRSPN